MTENSKIGVYSAINAIQAELCATGITKDRKNQQQGYSFRGIDDIYNAVSPLLAKYHLCILPRVLSRTVTEKTTKNGGTLFYSVVEVEFDFVCSLDGSAHVVRTIGEAMDSADKSSNKAMSAAYKYAIMQSFAIPTEGDNDADRTTHDVEISTLLKILREAAMGGTESLQAAHAKHKQDEDFSKTWQQHGAALKVAAQAAQ